MGEISFRLKALRRQYQFSLEQLSQRTGLTKSYLSKLERGVSEPSISTVLKLAQAYEIGVSQLIGTGEGGESEAISVVRRRSEEHTSELQSLMRISYAVFCLNNKKNTEDKATHLHTQNK